MKRLNTLLILSLLALALAGLGSPAHADSTQIDQNVVTAITNAIQAYSSSEESIRQIIPLTNSADSDDIVELTDSSGACSAVEVEVYIPANDSNAADIDVRLAPRLVFCSDAE